MILSISDFPNAEDYDAIESSIRVAEILAQGIDGANRQLELKEYTEIFELQSTSFTLAFYPLVSVLKIYYRGMTPTYYDLTYASAEWVEMAPDKYTVDTDTGEVILQSFAPVSSIRPPRMRGAKPQIKIKYSAGIDFTDSSAEVGAIKSALIELTNQLLLPSISQGVKSFEIDDEGHKTTYFGANESSITATSGKNKINSLLDFFKKYQPRSYAFR